MKKEDAIAYFGGSAVLARALGISPQAVCKWPDVVPLGRQYQLQHLTCGKLRVNHQTN